MSRGVSTGRSSCCWRTGWLKTKCAHGLDCGGALGPVGIRTRASACERSSWVDPGHCPMFRGARRMKNVHQARAGLRDVRCACIGQCPTQRHLEEHDEDARSPQGLTFATSVVPQSSLRELVRAALTLLTTAGDQRAHPHRPRPAAGSTCRRDRALARRDPSTDPCMFSVSSGFMRRSCGPNHGSATSIHTRLPHTSAHCCVLASVQPDGIAVGVGAHGIPGGFATPPPCQPRALCAMSSRSAPTELSAASPRPHHRTPAKPARTTRVQAP